MEAQLTEDEVGKQARALAEQMIWLLNQHGHGPVVVAAALITMVGCLNAFYESTGKDMTAKTVETIQEQVAAYIKQHKKRTPIDLGEFCAQLWAMLQENDGEITVARHILKAAWAEPLSQQSGATVREQIMKLTGQKMPSKKEVFEEWCEVSNIAITTILPSLDLKLTIRGKPNGNQDSSQPQP